MKHRGKNARTKWRELISEQARSRQTVTAFCRERGLCRSYFFAWKKRLGEDTTTKFLEVQLRDGAPSASRDTRVEIRLPNGRSLVVGRGFDIEHVPGVASAGGDGVMRGLPSLQAMDRAQEMRIWLASEAADMRCGFDRLAERVRAVIGQDPLSGHWFVFHSRRGDRLKILYWDRDGFALWYKRLEQGKFKLPRPREGARGVELRASELAMILDGIDVSKLKRVPRYEREVQSAEEKISTEKVII